MKKTDSGIQRISAVIFDVKEFQFAIGFNDGKQIKITLSGKTTTGILLIRNSWVKEWGDKGYSWLPYDYILNNLALDFWSLLGMDWIDSKQFGI